MYDRNILIEQTDPELWAAIQAENRRQEEHIELIASENYASPAVMAAQGTQLTNKYAEAIPASATTAAARTWTLPSNWRSTASSSCSAPRRQRAGALRRAGQRGRVPRLPEARRHHHGHEPGRRRPPHPRHAAQHERQVVQRGELRPEQGRSHRLRRDGAQGAREQAQADHRRRLGLFAAHRLRALRQGGQGRGRDLHGRHGALRRPDRRGRVSQPGAARGRGDLHRTRACAARAAAS